MGVKRRWKLGGRTGVTHALETAVSGRVRSPAGHSGDVELAVLGVKAAAVHAGEKLAGQRDSRALGLPFDRLAQDQEMRARAKTEMQKLARERAELAGGDAHLTAARIVEPARQVNQRQIRRAAVPGPVVAVMAAGPDLADHGGRRPFPLGVGNGDRAVGREPQAVGVAKAGCDGFERSPIGGDSQESELARGRVKPAGSIALEAADEIVARYGSRIGVAEALVKIGFIVAVRIMQASDLVAAQDVDFSAGNDQPQRLMQAACIAAPVDIFKLRVQAAYMPDVALHGAEHRGSIGQKIVAAEKQESLPRVVEGGLDGIDHIGPRAGVTKLSVRVIT